MSDMMEIETGDEMATRIAAVGTAVATAAEQLKRAAERLLEEEEQVKEAEERARTADDKIRAENRAHVAEAEAARATGSLVDAERRAREADTRLDALEDRATQAEIRSRAAEDQAAQTAAKSSALLEDLQKERGQRVEGEGRLRQTEQRVEEAEERARALDEQVQELKSRLSAIKKLQPGGMPVVADKERNALKDAVSSAVRRPPSSILGIALAMKHTDPKANEGQEMIRQLSSNARKLDRLVSVLLEQDRLVSVLLEQDRLMEGSLKPSRRRTDLQSQVRQVVEESPDLANHQVNVEGAHVIVTVDQSMTEQMVDSLLANPGRRAAPGSPIWVTISSDPEGAVIAVDDTNPEVPDGLRPSTLGITQDGRPVPRPTTAPTGMALLSRLADVHGGRARVEERAEGGVSFRVFLPDDVGSGDRGELGGSGAVALVAESDADGGTLTV